MMNAGELIARLHTMPPDAEVVLQDQGDQWMTTSLRQVRFAPTVHDRSGVHGPWVVIE